MGSPLKEDLRQFERVGRDLKKNSCGISVILLGDDEENKAKVGEKQTALRLFCSPPLLCVGMRPLWRCSLLCVLVLDFTTNRPFRCPPGPRPPTHLLLPVAQQMEALVNAARKEEGQRCDLIIVPPGVTPLEVVRNSALCANRTYGSGTTGAAGAGAGAGAAAGAGAGAGAGGEDEIQRAIRLSLLEQQGAAAAGADIPVEALTEEEQIRRAIAASMNDIAPANVPETPAAGGEDGDGDGDGEDEDDDDDDEDDEIAQALAMSQAQADADGGDDDDDEDDDDDDDDEAAMIAAAMKFSMAEAADTPDAGGAAAAGGGDSASSPPAIPAATDGGDSEGEGFSDPDYVATLLASIPGASIDDPIIQQALAEARKIQDEREGNNSGSGGGGGGDDSKKK